MDNRGERDYSPRMANGVLSGNIARLRKHLGLNQESFADKVDSAQANVSKWEKAGITPGARSLSLLAELAGWPVSRFLKDEWHPAAKADQSPTRSAHEGESVEILKLDLSLSMGPGTLIDDWVESEPVTFDVGLLRAITRSPFPRLRLVTGIGDSMYPTLNWGDTILIDTTDRALGRQDAIYWVSVYGAAGLKRLRTVGPGTVLVISDNPQVADQEVSAEDLSIEGRAIWFARGL